MLCNTMKIGMMKYTLIMVSNLVQPKSAVFSNQLITRAGWIFSGHGYMQENNLNTWHIMLHQFHHIQKALNLWSGATTEIKKASRIKFCNVLWTGKHASALLLCVSWECAGQNTFNIYAKR